MSPLASRRVCMGYQPRPLLFPDIVDQQASRDAASRGSTHCSRWLRCWYTSRVTMLVLHTPFASLRVTNHSRSCLVKFIIGGLPALLGLPLCLLLLQPQQLLLKVYN